VTAAAGISVSFEPVQRLDIRPVNSAVGLLLMAGAGGAYPLIGEEEALARQETASRQDAKSVLLVEKRFPPIPG